MRPSIVMLLVIVVLGVLPLLFGMEWLLLIELPGELPLGTLLAAVVLMAGAGVALIASEPCPLLRWVAIVLLIMSVAWLPAGIILSGSAALNFSGDAEHSAAFWRYTGITAGGVLLGMLWAGALRLRRIMTRSGGRFA